MKTIGSISALFLICWHLYSCNNSPKTEASTKDSSTHPDTATPIKSDTLTATALPENSRPTIDKNYTFPKPIWETHKAPLIEIEDVTAVKSYNDKNSSDDPLMEDSYPVYTVVDQMPEFKKFHDFFDENFTLTINNELSIDGAIHIEFIVDRHGNLGDVKILRSSGSKEIDDEVVKTIKKTSGMWTPGKIKGENVNTKITWPINIEFDDY